MCARFLSTQTLNINLLDTYYFFRVLVLPRNKCQKRSNLVRPADSEAQLAEKTRTTSLDGDLSDGEINYKTKLVMVKPYQDSEPKTTPFQNDQPSDPTTPNKSTDYPVTGFSQLFNNSADWTFPITNDPCSSTSSNASLNCLSASQVESEKGTLFLFEEHNGTRATCQETRPNVMTDKASSLTIQAKGDECQSKDSGTSQASLKEFLNESKILLDERDVRFSEESYNMPMIPWNKVVVNVLDDENIKSSLSFSPNVQLPSYQKHSEEAGFNSLNVTEAESSKEYSDLPVVPREEVVINIGDGNCMISPSTLHQNSSVHHHGYGIGPGKLHMTDLKDTASVKSSGESPCKTLQSPCKEVKIGLGGPAESQVKSQQSIPVNWCPEKHLYINESAMISLTAEDEVTTADQGDQNGLSASESISQKDAHEKSKLESDLHLMRDLSHRKRDLHQSFIVSNKRDDHLWKTAFQAMKKSKERYLTIETTMEEARKCDSRRKVQYISTDIKTDEKQPPLEEEVSTMHILAVSPQQLFNIFNFRGV